MKATYGNGLLTPADEIDNFRKHNDEVTAFRGLGIKLEKRMHFCTAGITIDKIEQEHQRGKLNFTRIDK